MRQCSGWTGWLGGVCAIGERTPAQAAESLHQLERAQLLLRNRRSSIAAESEFIFAHALTQEVAYGQIPRGERASKHQQAATWIEQLAGRREDKAELLAHHYSTALDLYNQSGQDAGSLAVRARAALIQAGRQAQALTAHATAAGHYARALELMADDDPARAPLLCDYALTRSLAGTPDEAVFQAAVDAQVASEDWERAAWMEHSLAQWASFRLGDRERADAHEARAAVYAARVPDRPITGLVAAARAYRLLVAGRTEEALAFVDEAERINQNAEGGALLLCRRGWARFDLGDIGGIDEIREGCRALAEFGNPRAAIEYSNFADDLMGLGDLAGASQARDMAAELGARTGEADAIAWIDLCQAEGAYHAGSWDDAVDVCSAFADGAERLNATLARSVRGRIVLGRGEIETAAADAGEILAYADSTDNAECYSMGLSLQALALRAAGREQEALETCGAYVARWVRHPVGNRSADLVAVALVLAESERRGEIAAAAARLPAGSPVRNAITAIEEGRCETAAQLLGAIGARPAAASAHAFAARRAAAEGRLDDATHHAAAAAEFFRGVSASLYARQMDDLLAAVEARRDQTA